MDEQQLISRFVGHFDRAGAGLLLGPGDDGALIRPTPGLALVATTDAISAGIHFSSAFTPADIGHKALAVNLSDLAAMGARPRWFLVALEIPRGFSVREIDGLARGMAALSRIHSCALAGGNVVRGAKLAITLTALGEVEPNLALRRDGLRPGDILTVTGALGKAALGLQRLRAGSRIGARAQLRPLPRISAGRAAIGISRAGMDVSDGLALDLERMAASSGCRVDLRAGDIPIARGASLGLALSGGEDYELLLGVSPTQVADLRRRLAKLGVPLTAIGTVRAGLGVFLDGRRLIPTGFDHLRGRR